ncbi:MAG: hypothetical protein RLZZ563_2048 [Pseudomonadota bacterium]|jgi:KDO2-lipid IV(A) lauroyltransferase
MAFNWCANLAALAVIRILSALPFNMRRVLLGFLFVYLIAPLGGMRLRIRENLALVFPGLPMDQVEHLCRAVPRNLGYTVAELFSARDLHRLMQNHSIEGDGFQDLLAARDAGRPVYIVTGHIGNYDALRAFLISAGFRIGGIYRPMDNPLFNKHYVEAISRIGEPLFARGRSGMSDMIRFLKSGGMVGVVLDQAARDGVRLRFLGKQALTSTAICEMALRYNALVLPAYGIRKGRGFRLIFESPIPRGSPREMTQALNDSLERHVLENMDQWLWTHRRWKQSRHAKD